MKKLYRSKTNHILGGVCGGIGEYLGIDPTVIRIIWAILTIITGFIPGVIAYIICWILIPEK